MNILDLLFFLDKFREKTAYAEAETHITKVTPCKRLYVTSYVFKNISLRDGEAIGGGFIFRNKNTQRFDQHASVPVPVPILRNIDLVRKVCEKAERGNRIF
jgi:hypothetical protein